MIATQGLNDLSRASAGQNAQGRLPIEVFPRSIREIILNLARYENFNLEYSASIVLSAVATALGNACHIRIKGEWKTAPSLYMMLVGRPGLGKTPPLGYLYTPINEYDDRLHDAFNAEYERYERAMASSKEQSEEGAVNSVSRPHYITTVIYDSTPEAMLEIHQHNRRGITLVVDEILALFNSVRRYNGKSNLIEDLLTAYSGQSLKIIRKGEPRPILIRNPCISIIGSIQTNLLQEVFRKEFMANGLLDRFLFVYPMDRRISNWSREVKSSCSPNTMNQWRKIIERIFSIPLVTNAKGTGIEPHVLSMSDEAQECFYNWYNAIIDSVNAIENDAEIESRKMKLNGHVARLALLFQVMRWAVGEAELLSVERNSVEAAIRMVDYYEATYTRLQEAIVISSIGDAREAWLSLLDDEFTTGEAVKVGRQVDMCRRSVFYALEQLCRLQCPLLEKIGHGRYRKTAAEHSNALCTIALSLSSELEPEPSSKSSSQLSSGSISD